MIARLHRGARTAFPLLVLIAGCGGGGQTSNSSAVVPVTAVATATPAATSTSSTAAKPTASATATATATAGASVTGNVVDLDTNAAIAGASVTVTGAAGATQTTSAGSGAFAFAAQPNALVAIGVTAPGYAPSLQGYTVAGTVVRPVKLVAIRAEIAAWLTLVNSDRAANGAPPLALSNELTIAARAQAVDEDRAGYIAHWNTAGQSADDQCLVSATMVCAQNGAGGFASTTAAEAAFLAERANCPGGVAAGCTYAENTGHFINLVTSNGNVGLGASHVNANAYTQDFAIVPTAVTDPTLAGSGKTGQPISITFRALASGTYYANWFWTTCPWMPFSAAALAAASPASPYAAGCTANAPAAAGLSITRSASDAALYTVTGTPPVAGTYSIGLAASAGWAALAVVNVPN
jgi:uncharacterized protein YkwD